MILDHPQLRTVTGKVAARTTRQRALRRLPTRDRPLRYRMHDLIVRYCGAMPEPSEYLRIMRIALAAYTTGERDAKGKTL